MGAVQLAAAGAPAQAKEALPLKPGPGVSCKAKVAVCPGVTVIEVEPLPAGEIEKAAFTVALTLITCGEFGASSVMLIKAERRPVTNGESEALIVQLAPTA